MLSWIFTKSHVLIEEDHTGVHHPLAEPGWTTYHIESDEDYDHAHWLLRLSTSIT